MTTSTPQTDREQDNLRAIREDSTVYSMAQAAAYLGICKRVLIDVLQGRKQDLPPIKHMRLGRRVLFRRAWLDQYLEECARR